jgi:signal transduction histidine kinase
VIFDNVSEDETYCAHPIPAKYGIQSYISVPVFRPDGRFFGTLCALDIKPAPLKTPEVVSMFKLFADLIGFHLDALDRLAESKTALLKEGEEAELRERFIAAFAHELRNPLEAINANSLFLLRATSDERVIEVAKEIRDSVHRMGGTTNDLLNFVRGHFAGGLISNRDARAPLKPVLEQVIAESRLIFPDRMIEAEFSFHEPVRCDRAQVAQLLSNLIGNALSYGAERSPVRARAFTTEGSFELSVSNLGDPIPATAIPRLFRPFTRGSGGPDRHGLGLGLYIASEIARAHEGTLTASSSPQETRFTFRMPLI